MDRPKKERLAEFYRRLRAAPPAGSHDEALGQIRDILNKVEDEMTSIPYNPANWQSDGRLYPPMDDMRRDVAGWPDVVRYRSKGHNTFIRSNGAVEIQLAVGGQVQFAKNGSDGRGVWEQ
jgi:hypothetical protein